MRGPIQECNRGRRLGPRGAPALGGGGPGVAQGDGAGM